MMSTKALTLGAAVVLAIAVVGAHAEQCGHAADGMECPNNLCCSAWGYCGMDANYCGDGCQSQCKGCGGGGTPVPVPTPSGGGVSSIISQSLFDQMLLHRNDAACQAKGFYNYGAFVAACTWAGSARTQNFGLFGTSS